MQLSDSDDEGVGEGKVDGADPSPDGQAVPKPSTGNKGKGNKKGNNAKPIVLFKRDPPVIRERPLSANQFRKVAANDTEIKVCRA